MSAKLLNDKDLERIWELVQAEVKLRDIAAMFSHKASYVTVTKAVRKVKQLHGVWGQGVENLKGEIWKPMTEFPESYAVSNMGRVKNVEREVLSGRGGTRRCFEKLRKTGITINDWGIPYNTVNCWEEGQQNTRGVAIAVLRAFGKEPEQSMVQHKNGDTLDDRLENLEWIVADENGGYVRWMRSSKSRAGAA